VITIIERLEEALNEFKTADYDKKVRLAHNAWGQEEIRSGLGQLLEDPDSIVRFRACFILAVISEEEPEAIRPFVPKLIKLLRDRSHNSDNIRSQAIFALLNMARKAPDAIEESITKLVHKLTDHDEHHVKWYWP
jgi:HEAT repeat protein